MGPVMIAAGGVAALGFASLALIGIPAIAGFGLACAYGIGSAVVLEMTFIPALRSLLPAPTAHAAAKAASPGACSTCSSARSCATAGRPVLIGAAVALAGRASPAALQIRTYGSTREYMAAAACRACTSRRSSEHFPGTVTMTILYEGEPGSAKSLDAAARTWTACAPSSSAIRWCWRTASLVDLVKMLHKTFNPDDPDPYRLPDDQELVSQLIFLGDSPAFERFIDRDYAKSLLVAYLRDDDSARVGPLVERARAWVDAAPRRPTACTVLIAGGAGPTVLAVNEHTTAQQDAQHRWSCWSRSTWSRRSCCARRSAACT